MESFSDGVIAVAATLLVLNITPPTLGAHESLAHGLLHQWPNYAAYAVSFTTIGIIWINHHAMISRLRIADHVILMLNLVLLLMIALLPFATSLLAAFLREGRGQHLAAARRVNDPQNSAGDGIHRDKTVQSVQTIEPTACELEVREAAAVIQARDFPAGLTVPHTHTFDRFGAAQDNQVEVVPAR